ncbi:ribosome small subunit-dependent GTPase A [Flaviflexus huanghaiensis]|uniref:ribosome small subunit-dependent GTPase A n=1 Tax=Flaviflexus huanghaiensis TaxID=1111473 RepID=UPI0015FC77D0|nr:ribosome small subunit-dependent GTPase A [Flaviflexus huanghaiensis]
MRDTGTDDPRVRVRPGRRGSRPRTKIRPDYEDALTARVYRVDRGRYHLVMDDADASVVAIKARELGRGSIVVGDHVKVVGDTSGRKDTLARIVEVLERSSALRRTAEEGEAAGTERVIVANADQLLIITALSHPEPRTGMIDRCLVAAYDAKMEPILVLTKADLADPSPLLSQYSDLDLRVIITTIDEETGDTRGVDDVARDVAGHISVLIGHSGVGKSTLINALVPHADRATGEVNAVTGRGRHTSSSAIAFDLPGGGIIIDTPGVRSFGLAHVAPDTLLEAFPDLLELARDCPRGCTHAASEPECGLDQATGPTAARVESFRRLLEARHSAEQF